MLESGGRELESEAVEAGTRYGDGEVTLWSNDVKTLIKEPGRTRKCRENRRRSIREAAKLEGHDFWATGNEPPWTMTIRADEIAIVLGDEQARHVASTGQPESDPGARSTVYRTTTADGLDMVVTLRAIACVDSMSGESFETIVEVRLAGRAYRGCGLTLHGARGI